MTERKAHIWKCTQKNCFFLIILITLPFLTIGCEDTEVYVGGELGPVEVTLSADMNGKFFVTGDISPELSFGLGPVDLKVGIQKTLELTETSPYTLFIVWQDEDGEVYRDSYVIGEKFIVKFSDNEIIEEIQGHNDSVIIVVKKPSKAENTIVVQNPTKVVVPTKTQRANTKTPAKQSSLTAIQFIEKYYQEINNRNYEYTWNHLSDNFKERNNCCNSEGEYDYQGYVNYWNSVEKVEISSKPKIVDQENVIEVTIVYYKEDGNDYEFTHSFHLVRINNNTDWVID